MYPFYVFSAITNGMIAYFERIIESKYMKLCILMCVYLILSFYTASYKKTSCLQRFFKLKNILIQDNAASNSTKLTIAHFVLNFPKTQN